jgi:transcriptional antiterminator NusG
MTIYAIRTTAGREANVLEKLAIVTRRKNYPIKAILLPKELKGYVLVESDQLSAIETALRGVNHARGVVRREISMDEIKGYLTAKAAVIQINRGDMVELIGGPFKGEKAKVQRVDKQKQEVTVELVEAAVPIPVTTPIEGVRLVQKAEDVK